MTRFARMACSVVTLCALAAASACDKDAAPAADKEPLPSAQLPSASLTSSASAASHVQAPPAPPVIPTLVLEEVDLGVKGPLALFRIEGALVVVQKHRVGRIIDDKIEWLGELETKEVPHIGPTRIDKVAGRYPDSIDLVYSTINGRAAMPTFEPLTGKGKRWTAAEGGGWGDIKGPVRVGTEGRTILLGFSYDGHSLITVRGPARSMRLLSSDKGCKEGEVPEVKWRKTTAIVPETIGATASGEVVVVGELCNRKLGGAQIWDDSGKTKIIELSPWIKGMGLFPELLPGKGDELWLVNDSRSAIVRYKGRGEFEAVPRTEHPIRNAFVFADGEIHVSDGLSIQRLEGNKWKTIAHIGGSGLPTLFDKLIMAADKRLWVNNGGKVFRLEKGSEQAAAEACKTPFVFLYQVSHKNSNNYTFPTTRKALSTFAEVSELKLVELRSHYSRYLGISVKSKAQGEAVIAHIEANMKDEHPRLLCYAPQNPRVIELKKK